MRRAIPLLLLLPGLLLAACAQAVPDSSGSGGSSDSSDRPGPRTDYRPDEVVLRVEHVGGFVPVDTLVTRLPIVSVYGDGRVITEGPQIMIYPGPALPNLLVRLIGAADLNRLVSMAVDAGVGAEVDYGSPNITDMPDTRFTVSTDAGVLTTEVYALGMAEGLGEEVSGLSEEQLAARRKLIELQTALTDLPGTLGAQAVGEEQAYEPTAIAAVTSPFVEPDDDLEHGEMAWPGPALPGEQLGDYGELRCVTVTGADVAAVLEAAAEANQRTQWVWEDQRWFVTFRPLLPDESTCADLTA